MADGRLKRVLVSGMQDMLGADRQLLKAFPRLARAAGDRDVKKLCREGVDYTEERIARLERGLRLLGDRPRARRSAAMAGLIDTALDVAGDDASDARDAAILASVQAISHYGRSGYWTLCAYAEAAGERKAKTILMKSLKEKEEAIGEEMRMAESDIIPRLARMRDERQSSVKPSARKAGSSGRRARARRSKAA